MVLQNIFLVIGRIGLASLFLLGGINKILNYESTLTLMAEAGLQPAGLLLPLTILLEVVGALIIMFGRPKAHYAAFILAMFTLATNMVFHDFWTMDGLKANLELSLFFKNIAIAGALVFLGGSFMSRQPS